MNCTIMRFTGASAFRWRVRSPPPGAVSAGALRKRSPFELQGPLREHEVRYATPIQVRQIIAPFESVSQKSPMEMP